MIDKKINMKKRKKRGIVAKRKKTKRLKESIKKSRSIKPRKSIKNMEKKHLKSIKNDIMGDYLLRLIGIWLNNTINTIIVVIKISLNSQKFIYL